MAMFTKMAGMNGESTPEYLTVQKCYRMVVGSMKEHSRNFCNALFEKGHIPDSVREFIHADRTLPSEKANMLGNTLIDKIKVNPKVYHDFVDILKKDSPWADNLIKQLEEQFQEERAASVDSNSSLVVSIPRNVKPAAQNPESNNHTCPTSSDKFKLPENGVSKLPSATNRTNHSETAMEIDHLCDCCDEKLNAITICQQCGRMCSKCYEKHNKWKPNLSHTVSNISGFKTDTDKPANTSTCTTHYLKDDLFCITCSELICIYCTNDGHKGHTFQFAKHVFQEHKSELESHLHQLKERLEKEEKTIRDFDCRAEDIKRQREDIADEIEKEFIQLNHFLNEHKRNLLNTLDSFTHQKLNDLSAKTKTITAKKAQISDCLEYAEARLKTGSLSEVFKVRALVHKQVEELFSTEFDPGTIPKADIELMSDSQALATCKHIYEISTDSTPTAMYSYIDGKSFAIVDSTKQPSAVVHLRNKRNEKCNSDQSLNVELVHTKNTEQVNCTVTRENDQCVITYRPVKRGRHSLNVKINGKHILGSPHLIAVAPAMKTLHEPVAVISDLKLSTGVAAGKLQVPHRVVTNSKGHMIVADFRDCTVSTITTKGVLLRKFGGTGRDVGKFRQPCGVVVDDEDNIYVADNDNSRIQKFAPDGTFLNAVGSEGSNDNQLYFPIGVCFNKMDQCLYICDQNNHRIQVISIDFATFERHFGEKGRGNGQLEKPKYAVFDSFNNLYVTDETNNRVQAFTADGRYLRTISKKRDDKHLDQPYGIAIDSADIVYVSELRQNCISMFTAEGQFITSFGETGEKAGQFNRIRALYIDNDDSLIVSEAGNSRIQIFADKSPPES